MKNAFIQIPKCCCMKGHEGRLCIGLSVILSIGEYPISCPFCISCEIMKLSIRLPMVMPAGR